MSRIYAQALAWVGLLLTAGRVFAAPAPAVEEAGQRVTVTGERYRAIFQKESASFELDLRGADGEWHAVAANPGAYTFAYYEQGEHAAGSQRATWAMERGERAVTIGRQVVLSRAPVVTLDLHFICTASGVLLGSRLAGVGAGTLWSPPRIALPPADWQGYLFWDPEGKAHQGKLAALGPPPAYAGASAWGENGDTAKTLDPRRPALVAESAWGCGLGVVFVEYAERWGGAHSFLQRHTPANLFLYASYVPAARAAKPLWAWLAPITGDAPAAAARVEALVKEGEALVAAFRPLSKPVPEAWGRPLPEFPAGLKRPRPVADINDAIVYTINETTRTQAALDLARKAGSDVLIRGWFKWNQAPPVGRMREIPEQARAFGALFGGGITCSALYDTENGITREQLLDMATRGPAGQLIDAWEQPGTRHGSLSSPAYLDYLFRWCREQIDAGVDMLFMDEHTAALGRLEGYDDHSLRDFRRYLLEVCPQTQGWKPDDPRWKTQWQIDTADRALCPDGTIASFDYRAFLRARGLLETPDGPGNPLATLWHQFRRHRDDRAWKALTDRIRAYAREKGRTVLIDANGIAPYVDLQVLGVWGQWTVRDGRIDLSENQLPYWRSLVTRGHNVAGKRVPVVLFHDWGFGDTPFPWMAVSPSDRETWMRTRGAEIYAAGGFFAFPVLGPFGCDSSRDGTFPTIVRQTAFYQRHRDLYLRGRYLGAEALRSETPALSLALWQAEDPRTLALHVINRNVHDGVLQVAGGVTVELPLGQLPETVALISPDWDGERTGMVRKTETDIVVTLPEVDAYVVALLRFKSAPDVSRVKDPARVMLAMRWERPTRSEFAVLPGGMVANADALNGCMQGKLHTHLYNPPTFLTNALAEGKLLVKVRAVSMGGARFEYRVDGKTRQTEDLPDKDGKNDGNAAEYDRVLTFPVPAGKHRLTLDNVGADWANVTWLAFEGQFGEWTP